MSAEQPAATAWPGSVEEALARFNESGPELDAACDHGR